MDFNDYQKEAVANKIYGYGEPIVYPTLGLVGEAGEVAGKVKKVLRDNEGEFDTSHRDKIIDECGDVLWYLAALADDLGVTLGDFALANLKKISSRRSRGVVGGSGDNR